MGPDLSGDRRMALVFQCMFVWGGDFGLVLFIWWIVECNLGKSESECEVVGVALVFLQVRPGDLSCGRCE